LIEEGNNASKDYIGDKVIIKMRYAEEERKPWKKMYPNFLSFYLYFGIYS